MERRRPRQLPARLHVLVVAEPNDALDRCVEGLAAQGFETTRAADGPTASARAWEMRPDILAIELPMPNYDGWQFLQDVKQNPRTRAIPVVVLSSSVRHSLCDLAGRDGFAAFFATPCPVDELALGLRQVLFANGHVEGREQESQMMSALRTRDADLDEISRIVNVAQDGHRPT